MRKIGDWMKQNGIVSFKAFSATDAGDLPTGWTKPDEFSLDGVAFYDGRQMSLFVDEVHMMMIKDKSTKTYDLSDLQSYDMTDKKLIGYGSSKFDMPLLKSQYPNFASVPHTDLAKIVFDASAKHYESHGRRYDLRMLASTNYRKQTAIPHLSFMLKPIALLTEWRQGLARNVMRTLAAEAELIAELYALVNNRETIRIVDERTDRIVSIPCDIVRDANYEEE